MQSFIIWKGTEYVLVSHTVGSLQAAHTQHTTKERQVVLALMPASLEDAFCRYLNTLAL